MEQITQNGSADEPRLCEMEGEAKAKNVEDLDWKWPTHEKWYSHLEGEWKVKETTNLDDGKEAQSGLQCPFEVTRVINDSRGGLSEVFVKLRSPYLKSIAQKYLPRLVESLCDSEPSVEAKDFYTIRESLQSDLQAAVGDGKQAQAAHVGCDVHGSRVENGLRETLQLSPRHGSSNGPIHQDEDDSSLVRDSEESRLANLHLRHLLRFLNAHFKDTCARCAWMRREGLVSYNMLWAFLMPGVKVRRICKISGQECLAEVRDKGKYSHKDWAPDKNAFKFTVKVTDYNGESFRFCKMKYKIKEFDGEVPFVTLPVCPWYFVSAEEQQGLADRLLNRGRLFYECAVKQPFQFMHFQGSLGSYEMNDRGCFQLRRANADGRVMVDLLSLARANPEWPMENAQPPTEVLRLEVHAAGGKEPTEEQLRSAPAIVYGFSFSLKKWGCFDVEGLREISFEERAYEQLVMKSTKQKEMLRAIVESHLSAEGRKGVDLIAKKGEGCVVLCYGPPGTGKTLTAETLAESLRRPLWAVSAFELGEYSSDVERKLSQVLSTALRWRAVVLLDEADGYLERRADGDLMRNLLTGVFLRLLEYHGGVLFLTTNRVGAFDEAFMSRISFCISYPALDDQRRALIWQSLLARAGVAAGEEELSRLVQCEQPLNGREIRNIISLAQTWSHSQGRAHLTVEHVQDALQLVLSGTVELKEDLC